MKYRFIALITALCLISSFSGCKFGSTEQVSSLELSTSASNTSEVENSSSASSLSASSNLSTDSGLPEANFSKLLSQISDHDRTVEGYGKLKTDSTYSNALKDLESVLDNYTYDISVVAYSIDGTKAISYNTQKEMFCACTVKAAYTLYCCKEMEQGNGSLKAEMVYKEEHYEGGTGNMQYSSFGTVFSMDTILRKSMGISDNVGYRMSIDYFGREGYNEWITDQGCSSLTIKPTVWSLKTKSLDLAKVWGMIYNYFKTDSEYARFLYETCTNTANNYGTAALKNVDISHKQGHSSTSDWPAYSDAGIVWKENGPYVYVILTNSPGPSSYNTETMANIISIIDGQLFN